MDGGRWCGRSESGRGTGGLGAGGRDLNARPRARRDVEAGPPCGLAGRLALAAAALRPSTTRCAHDTSISCLYPSHHLRYSGFAHRTTNVISRFVSNRWLISCILAQRFSRSLAALANLIFCDDGTILPPPYHGGCPIRRISARWQVIPALATNSRCPEMCFGFADIPCACSIASWYSLRQAAEAMQA